LLQAATAADSEDATQRTADVLQQRLALLSAKLADAEEERRAELAPDIRAAKEELGTLRSQLQGERARAEAAQREAADIAWRLEAVGPLLGCQPGGPVPMAQLLVASLRMCCH
jgi:predicted  nucleic acid-binding Zn-ribbon protein